MELWFMGTSAGMPIADRNVTSIALRVSENKGMFWLFDCGEGTQHQLLRTPFRLTKLTKLFITHLHGDHLFGLPGLLSSRSSLGGTEPLTLYGPTGLQEFVDTAMRISGTHLGYPMEIQEIEEGIVFEDDAYKVEAAALEHRIECFGYRVTEHPRIGALNTELLAELGVPPGPLFGSLKSGQDALLQDGRIIRSADVVGASLLGRVVVVLGDTKVCDNSVALAQGADLLVHEATFGNELTDKAAEYGHATALQAAETAKTAGVKRLLITHFSSRYRQEDLARLEAEARVVFSSTDAAVELVPFSIPRTSSFDSNT